MCARYIGALWCDEKQELADSNRSSSAFAIQQRCRGARVSEEGKSQQIDRKAGDALAED